MPTTWICCQRVGYTPVCSWYVLVQVALSMFYTADAGMQHATTYFNRTIDIVEPHTWVDFQALFLFFLILAALGGLGEPFWCMSYLLLSPFLSAFTRYCHAVLFPSVGSLGAKEEEQPCEQLCPDTPWGTVPGDYRQVLGSIHAGPSLGKGCRPQKQYQKLPPCSNNEG